MTEPMKLIPLSEITPEARKIAVTWIENYQRMGFDIEQKHKLASDIMNYAAGQVLAERERIKNAIRELPVSSVGFSDWEYLVKEDILKLIDSL